MSKRTIDQVSALESGERIVRAKADAGTATPASGEEDVLDALYAQDEKTAVNPPAAEAAAPAAATASDANAEDSLNASHANEPTAAATPQPAEAEPNAAGAVDDDDILDALYGAAAEAAAETADNRIQEGNTRPAAPASTTAPWRGNASSSGSGPTQNQQQNTQQQQQQQPSSPTSSGGGGGSNSSGRVPPTHITKPDLPKDLSVFNNAVLLVDKPKEWTSFDACNAIKGAMKRLGVKKVGHAGTLDPAATGLLIICTGAGTKSIEGFMAAHKEYSGTLKLGEGTESLDAELEVTERLPWEHITDEQLVEAAKKLTGDIEQVPPMYSALHHQGQRLHELARAGVKVERPARPVTITRFDVHRDPDDRQLVHFYVGCSKGTYIRTLGHDLATSLGTTGHLVALRREAIGEARVDNAWGVKEFVDKLWAEIREQQPSAANDAGGNANGKGDRRNRGGRGRGGGRRGGNKQQQAE